MRRRVPPMFLQTQNGDEFRSLFHGNVATELGHGIPFHHNARINLTKLLQRVSRSRNRRIGHLALQDIQYTVFTISGINITSYYIYKIYTVRALCTVFKSTTKSVVDLWHQNNDIRLSVVQYLISPIVFPMTLVVGALLALSNICKAKRTFLLFFFYGKTGGQLETTLQVGKKLQTCYMNRGKPEVFNAFSPCAGFVPLLSSYVLSTLIRHNYTIIQQS